MIRTSSHLLNSTVLAGAATVSLLLASPAQAQSADQSDPTSVTPQPQDDAGDIVVTGTLIGNNRETASPVTTLTASALARANITTISDAIRSVSADGAGSISTGFRTGFSAGGSAVSLRGLGVSSTVILIDGLRSANYPINDDGHNAYVDLNSIPFSIVDRVDVLKDGASSTYGADAIGGVVNIITRKHFRGLEGSVQGGSTQRGDGSRYRATLTGGVGDYQADGWNLYLNGEYQYDGKITNHDVGFPFNTTDLSSIGGIDKNTADSSLTTSTPNAVVTRVGQTDLNNPLAGQAGTPLTNLYQLLNPGACANGTFTVTSGAAQGTGCKHTLPDEYFAVQPIQERYSASARLSVRVADGIEAYASGTYAHNRVTIFAQSPLNIRQTQPYGSSPAMASSNPGIVLPVYVCSAGTNCATASDRRLNPNNPYAAAFANDPSHGAARIFYLFGDLPFGTERSNRVLRATAGISGHVGDGWNFRVEGMVARDDVRVTNYGTINIAGLVKAINTGAYNFVDPSKNTAEVRNLVSPAVTTPSHSTIASIDANLSKAVASLPGGNLIVAVGGQVRHETLVNRSANPNLDFYGATTSSAFGNHTVTAGFFEADAPILSSLDVNLSGRYDHYSEGFGHFSPKVGVKFTPIRAIALRGTYSQGFRAPTFAESNPKSSFAGFSPINPSAAFVAAHGGSSNPYTTTYNLGTGLVGNPALKPEKSRSFTLGVVFQPARWLTLTADYYNIKKSNLISAGPKTADAIKAYYGVAGNSYPTADAASNAGCAAVAAVGTGYTCSAIDAVDPLHPGALPRLLILNVPFVNSDYEISSGMDFSVNADIPLADGVRWVSHLDLNDVIQLDLHSGGVVQKYAGTLGPYNLSSGSGTPKWRGSWQNTLKLGRYTLTATTYYVSRIKEVAADNIAPDSNGHIDLSCASNSYGTGDKFCYIKSFIDVDLNFGADVGEKFHFFFNIQNVFNARAPVAPGAYLSAPNYLASWHYAGLVGRSFSAGAKFKF